MSPWFAIVPAALCSLRLRRRPEAPRRLPQPTGLITQPWHRKPPRHP